MSNKKQENSVKPVIVGNKRTINGNNISSNDINEPPIKKVRFTDKINDKKKDKNNVSIFMDDLPKELSEINEFEMLQDSIELNGNHNVFGNFGKKSNDIYYKQTKPKQTRIGDRYQATYIPSIKTNINNNDNNENKCNRDSISDDDDRFAGEIMNVNPMNNIETLQNDRNKHRQILAQIEEQQTNTNNNNNDNNNDYKWTINNINIDDDDDDDDFDINEEMDNNDSQTNNNDPNIPELLGIIGHRTDWINSDINNNNESNKTQYLVKWKGIMKPEWKYESELLNYQDIIDKYYEYDYQELFNQELMQQFNHKN